MKRPLVAVLMLLLLSTTILQTFRVSHWKRIADSKTADCNRVIALNDDSFQKSSNSERAIWMQVRDNLWHAYALQEERIANRLLIIDTPREIQLLRNVRSGIEGVRDETQQIFNGKYAITHLSTDNH